MKYFEFRLANGEEWFLKTEDNYNFKHLKYDIENNKWIKLNSSGSVYIPNGVKFIPKEADIQTCNIISVIERENYQRGIDKWNIRKEQQDILIKKIEKYEFNFRMKVWSYWNSSKDLTELNDGCLKKILSQCIKYKCKLKEK